MSIGNISNSINITWEIFPELEIFPVKYFQVGNIFSHTCTNKNKEKYTYEKCGKTGKYWEIKGESTLKSFKLLMRKRKEVEEGQNR